MNFDPLVIYGTTDPTQRIASVLPLHKDSDNNVNKKNHRKSILGDITE